MERAHAGPARISGLAGTGKTVVALLRAVHMARDRPTARVPLTTSARALAHALQLKLRLLAGNEPTMIARITVTSMTGRADDLHTTLFGQPNIAPAALVQTLLAQAARETDGDPFSAPLLAGGWSEVVDAWRKGTREACHDLSRLGRKTRIGGRQRKVLWSILERLRSELDQRRMVTWPCIIR